MNATRFVLVISVAIFVLLSVFSRRHARIYGRWMLLGVAAILVLAPFVWLLAAIFKDRVIFDEYLFLPPPSQWSSKTINLDNFRELFRGKPSVHGTVYFWQYIINSTVYATVSTVLNLLFCSLAGFALAKYDFRGKAPLMIFMLGSMTIPSALLLAPLYKMVVDLGMVDSLAGLIVPGMVSAYGIFLFRQACMNVPDEMLDAGRIDGCSEMAIYFRLVMPLVRPMSAAFCLMTFLGTWNAFFMPNVFLQTQKNFTLPIVLYMFISDYQNNYGVFLAGTALAMVPPMILFFALEKEFISGLTSGAVKG
ncbi:MAG: carbohydrate ABC transporter permease [Polyangiaceae bacterium]|jgi:ABC-type glycerol-3-phosphate transport system permease component